MQNKSIITTQPKIKKPTRGEDAEGIHPALRQSNQETDCSILSTLSIVDEYTSAAAVGLHLVAAAVAAAQIAVAAVHTVVAAAAVRTAAVVRIVDAVVAVHTAAAVHTAVAVDHVGRTHCSRRTAANASLANTRR